MNNNSIKALPNNVYLSKKLNEQVALKNKQVSDFKQVLQQYEGLVLAKMLEQIFENQEPDPLTGGGFAEETLNSFLIQEYATKIAENGKLNLTKDIKNQLLNKYQYNNQYGEK